MTWRGACVAALLCVMARTAPAQITTNSTATPMGRALMAERNGAYADAATVYGEILAHDPANVGALTGMSHVLPRLGRTAQLDSVLHAALAIDSVSGGVLGIAIGYFAGRGESDSAGRYAAQWAHHDPGDDEPYREWYEAAVQIRDLAQARAAIRAGRERLGPGALAIEGAQLLQSSGDYAGATREWINAVRNVPVLRNTAVEILLEVPAGSRSVVRDALVQDTSVQARQIFGLIRIRWGEARDGAAMIARALPATDPAAAQLLEDAIAELQGKTDRESRQAAATLYEALSGRSPAADRVRPLMSAARAYADAADDADARRILDQVARMPNAPADMATAASVTLINVLIAEHKLGDAGHLLSQVGARVTPDQHDDLARRLAFAWAVQGQFDRADSLVAADSSVAGFDMRGRLRVYRGDLAGANDLLKYAGPYGDDRDAALRRVRVLTWIQALGRDTSAAFGAAMLTLDRGDSAAAVGALDQVAADARPAGAAALRIGAARIALALHDTATAVRLASGADIPDAPAAAAESRLLVARVSAARGASQQARRTLEHLLTDFPESAVAPAARQLYDALPADSAGGI